MHQRQLCRPEPSGLSPSPRAGAPLVGVARKLEGSHPSWKQAGEFSCSLLPPPLPLSHLLSASPLVVSLSSFFSLQPQLLCVSHCSRHPAWALFQLLQNPGSRHSHPHFTDEKLRLQQVKECVSVSLRPSHKSRGWSWDLCTALSLKHMCPHCHTHAHVSQAQGTCCGLSNEVATKTPTRSGTEQTLL